jgi:hypothetical protein
MCRDAGVDAADGSAEGLNCDPLAALCDVLPPPCMGGGEVREVGCHDELLRQPGGLYSRLHELQFTPEGQVV